MLLVASILQFYPLLQMLKQRPKPHSISSNKEYFLLGSRVGANASILTVSSLSHVLLIMYRKHTVDASWRMAFFVLRIAQWMRTQPALVNLIHKVCQPCSKVKQKYSKLTENPNVIWKYLNLYQISRCIMKLLQLGGNQSKM